MILNALTIFHVALSLVGIGSGVVAIYGLQKAKTPGRWTQVFLDGGNKPYRFLVPVSRRHACPGARRPFSGRAVNRESEPPFQIAQLAALLLFAAIGVRAATAKPQRGLVP